MFSNKYCSKKRQMVKNGLTIILLTGWHKNELSVLECAIGSALARNKGEDESNVIRHLSQRVAVVLARLNASMLLNRAPQNTPTNIDGIE